MEEKKEVNMFLMLLRNLRLTTNNDLVVKYIKERANDGILSS